MNLPRITSALVLATLCAAAAKKPIKVFVLAGDDNMMERGVIEGRTPGLHEDFFPNAAPTAGEKKKHVRVSVYDGAWSAQADFDKLPPAMTGEVELGEQITKQAQPGKRGRVAVPMTPFPERALQDGTTTRLEGWFSVARPGRYEFLVGGDGDAAYNRTTVEGREVYRQNVGEKKPVVTAIELEAGRRHAFQTVYFKKPGPEFRIALTNTPGALTTVVAENPRHAYLRNAAGEWVKRDDVALYDAHPIHNNTKGVGHFLQVGDVSYGGQPLFNGISPALSLGHVLGNHFEEPVLLLRFALSDRNFTPGTRSLGHDYRPPSSGGTPDLEGSWDVIHFNWGVWDATYREETSKYYQGRHTTSVEEYEKNLRTLVARMKQTGATLIWASTTTVWEGEPGKPNADETAFNAVAEKVMRENGVLINDLNAESIRQGFPKSTNVHSVGNFAPLVTDSILKALAARKQNTQPLPRVLMIGDSITGTYVVQVMKNLDGKAFVCKNPGNGEHTWNGLKRIDDWLNLKNYLLNGQEYLELLNGVKDALANPERVYPDYKGQGFELAGFVWFQGLADARSDAMSAAYETNLAHLITDVRKDLNSPVLPFVVAALGYGDENNVGKNPNLIRAAQMAVGDPEKHPQFKGNVTSVDTRPFFLPSAQSPGGRPQYYYGNAGSFLNIGDAMGKAMVELIKD